MKVFVTGATGYVGSAVAAGLARAGHEVFGLARSEEKGRALAAQEIHPVRGDMAEPESFYAAAAGCQALVHCAAEPSDRFHDLDRSTVEVLLKAVREAQSSRVKNKISAYSLRCGAYNSGTCPASCNPGAVILCFGLGQIRSLYEHYDAVSSSQTKTGIRVVLSESGKGWQNHSCHQRSKGVVNSPWKRVIPALL